MTIKHTYFIKCNNCVKIGTTTDIKSRIKQIQTNNPYKLEILLTIPLPNIKGLISLLSERKLHKKFNKYRIRGEWFKLSEEILEFIKKNKKNNL